MAIKGGNPLFKIDVVPLDGTGFRVSAFFPKSGETLTRDVLEGDVLYKDYAIFGAETKFRNTIGAIADPAKRTHEDAFERAQAIFAAHDDGEWNVGRTGEAQPTGGLIAQAIATVLGRSVAQVIDHVKAQFASIEDEKERKKALRAAWESFENPDNPDAARFLPTIKKMREEAAALRAKRAKIVKVNLEGLTA